MQLNELLSGVVVLMRPQEEIEITSIAFDSRKVEKGSLFCCIPDSDKSLNYLVGMIYTQLIQTLYRQADRIHKGRLPVPVHLKVQNVPSIQSWLPECSWLHE